MSAPATSGDSVSNPPSIAELVAHPFDLSVEEKRARLLASLRGLTEHHRRACPPYDALVSAMFEGAPRARELAELPFVPVGLFKMLALKSVSDADVFKVLTSSGTSGQRPSRIFLDRETASIQSKALVSITKSFIGGERLPMIVVDTKSVLSNRESMSARGAGIMGFSTFGRDHLYLLDERMQLDWPALEAFAEKHRASKILVFGFTWVVWQYFLRAARARGTRMDLHATLIHGGGWKKLKDERVSKDELETALRETLGIARVHNYYGLVEQVGSVFMECEHGALHTPSFADVIVRDPATLEPVPRGKVGVLQVLSALPRSYPGHSILTEDLAIDLGDEPCICGRGGRRVRIEGRMPEAELRGCSDVIAAVHA